MVAVRTPSAAHLGIMAVGLLPPLAVAWILWFGTVDGLSADRTALAARDFTALWSAGRAAAEHAFQRLASPEEFTALIRHRFGQGMPDQIWPYPPPILLLARPLADLPLLAGFLLYVGGSAGLLALVLRWGGLGLPAIAASLLSPAAAETVLTGQNGLWTAALLAGGLLLIDRYERTAGLLLGCLVLKPQLALLVPICLVAGRRWRTLGAAAATSLILVGISVLAFGPQPWEEFFRQSQPGVSAYFEAPWHAGSAQALFASPFMAARSLGATLALAYVLQAATSLGCAATAWLVWRRQALTAPARMAATVPLCLLASPWIHAYDMPALAVAIVVLAAARASARPITLAIAWCLPGLASLMTVPPVLPVLALALTAWVAWDALRA